MEFRRRIRWAVTWAGLMALLGGPVVGLIRWSPLSGIHFSAGAMAGGYLSVAFWSVWDHRERRRKRRQLDHVADLVAARTGTRPW